MLVDGVPTWLSHSDTYLARTFLNDPRCPPDELFRWHSRQAVLANMKGAGEPIFEFDLPPGSGMSGLLAPTAIGISATGPS